MFSELKLVTDNLLSTAFEGGVHIQFFHVLLLYTYNDAVTQIVLSTALS